MKRLIVLILSFLFLPSVEFGQSARETIKALKKFEAKIQVGILYEPESCVKTMDSGLYF